MTKDTTNPTQGEQSGQNGRRTVLVTGGTGKTGRRVAARLRERGVPVRAVSRSAEVPFDWSEPDTWEAALDGVGAAYLAYAPDISMPGAAPDLGAFARRAAQRGVGRVVLLSGRGMTETAGPAERAVREAVEGTGTEWVILRGDWFAQNFSEEFFAEEMRAAGTFTFPGGEVPSPFIDLEDLAEVAAAALTAPEGYAGQVHELTGPRPVTYGQAMKEISAATGREFRYVAVSTAAYLDLLVAQGLPEDFARMFGAVIDETLDGRNARPTDTVARLLGRPPRDFAAYAARAAAEHAWDPAPGHGTGAGEAAGQGGARG
ncbi:NAD(P)H-binding protein [Streptomyces sp. YIM 98790]|uniref:NAD(P)H-binding protein n=1 Tax=Streptomyces sp. YIM 98790 TaxID=2689077 RepID=UPI001FB77922|nr:NAD(P)H-binding protein [Streptomyces sp. YIM 98790]